MADRTKRSVRLSDGSVVIVDGDGAFQRHSTSQLLGESFNWLDIVMAHDCGADFDALKAFAPGEVDASESGRQS